MEFSDNTIDAVLMLGPLYHLTEQPERLHALRETYRVLRPDGWLIAAAISRYASILEYLKNEQLRNATFAEIAKQDLAKGQHRNATDNWDYFTTAYFHRPEDLQSEMEMAGFTCQAVLGVEGPGWMFTDFKERGSDGRQRRILMQIAHQLENEPSIIGPSAHLLAVARKGI